MNQFRRLSDTAAISLSFLCSLHCLALPVTFAIVPSAVASFMQEETFHLLLVLAVIPLSIFALAMGCKKHKQYPVLILGLTGLTLLLSAAFLGHNLLDELGEKVLTLIGSLSIAIAHICNFYCCKQDQHCDCSD